MKPDVKWNVAKARICQLAEESAKLEHASGPSGWLRRTMLRLQARHWIPLFRVAFEERRALRREVQRAGGTPREMLETLRSGILDDGVALLADFIEKPQSASEIREQITAWEQRRDRAFSDGPEVEHSAPVTSISLGPPKREPRTWAN